MALEHVCLLTDHGPLPILAEQAKRDYPQVKPSVANKNYICMLCHQYVTLVSSKNVTAHFKHSRGERDKNCPERSHAQQETDNFQKGLHAPRIRIAWQKGKKPQFFVGLSRKVLTAWIASQECEGSGPVTISIEVNGSEVSQFNDEWWQQEGLTYFLLGSEPPQKLLIHCQQNGQEISHPWQTKGKFFRPEGAIYDWETGIFQMYDTELRLDCDYLLLTGSKNVSPELQPEYLYEYHSHYGTLYLYKIRMQVANKNIPLHLQRDVLKFHYWLTDAPLRLRPIWPVLIRDFGEIHIAKRRSAWPEIYFAMRARERQSVKVFSCEGSRIHHTINFRGDNQGKNKWSCGKATMRQGLLTVLMGRVRALEALYIVSDHHLGESSIDQGPPAFAVTTQRQGGEQVVSGVCYQLPAQGKIYLTSVFEHTIRVYRAGWLVQCVKRSEQDAPYPVSVSFGNRVELIIGCDRVFTVTYLSKVRTPKVQLPPELAAVLTHGLAWSGQQVVPIDRLLIEAAKCFSPNHQFAIWWQKVVRRGSVPQGARKRILRAWKKEREQH